MTRRTGVLRLGLLITVAIACGPVPVSEGLGAPVNDCSVSPCDQYMQPGAAPTCSDGNSGMCLVAEASPLIVFVVDLPEDSFFDPGRTFALSPSQLLPSQGTASCPVGECAHLPSDGEPRGSYLPSPDVAAGLNYNLGNGDYTAIPVHTTYRPFVTLPSGSAVEAASIGLPLNTVAAQSVTNPDEGKPGPFGGLAIEFLAYMQPGSYERTIMPDPPLDSAFPPDIDVIPVDGGTTGLTFDYLDGIDQTTYITGSPAPPRFEISRIAGLDGWTAFLRDTRSGRRISNIVALSGDDVPDVLLATNHHPPSKDALEDAALIVAPPTGLPIPTGVFTPTAHLLPSKEVFPDLPGPASVRGNVIGSDGTTPVEGDIVFELTAAYDAKMQLQKSNFEFTATTHAVLDPSTQPEQATFAVTLPRGQYRVTVRPSGGADAVTIINPNPFTVSFTGDPLAGNQLQVQPTFPVTAPVVVADSRPLSGATVVAVPVTCSDGTTSSACLPREGQTTTGADGTFGTCDAHGDGCPLLLDPGGYVLQVRPLDGTGLPWVVQSLLVQAGAVTLTQIAVPAPVYAGLRLVDPFENPIVRAIVRVFTMPTKNQVTSVEIGRAITDENGHFDMYLDPNTQ
jgi:hypothetical protein